MNDLLAALLLGIIEGITEFLPISSTGHLLIAEHWLGVRSELFNIAVQAGAILAVVLIYWKRLWGMLLAFAGKDAPAAYDPLGVTATPAQSRDYAFKLLAAFAVTAALGLLVKKLGWQLPEAIRPVAWALILGAGWMLLAEAWATRRIMQIGERTTITWTVAILVGLAQVVAGVFPGTSRSAATIFIALLAGTTSRAAATEFAFVVGIPTMFAATGYELLKLLKGGGIGSEDWTALGVACAASAITAFIAVKWLLRYIQSHRFTAFAVYRLIIGIALLLWLPSGA
ncbi:MAG: undecaprenyl-diphosphate phosphatase [Xanthomonadaceae bacterium]|nr:undecaprenyl-diphosphate phosphatase [Xanthomonadaceae bacterium]